MAQTTSRQSHLISQGPDLLIISSSTPGSTLRGAWSLVQKVVSTSPPSLLRTLKLAPERDVERLDSCSSSSSCWGSLLDNRHHRRVRTFESGSGKAMGLRCWRVRRASLELWSILIDLSSTRLHMEEFSPRSDEIDDWFGAGAGSPSERFKCYRSNLKLFPRYLLNEEYKLWNRIIRL